MSSDERAQHNWTRLRKDIVYQILVGKVENSVSDEGKIRHMMCLQNLISSLTVIHLIVVYKNNCVLEW